MAKMSNNNPNNPFSNMQHPQQETPPPHQREQPPRYVFRISWLLVPLVIGGMWYVLSHTAPVLKWSDVMDFLQVHNRERYTRLAVLCLVLVFIVAVIRILRKRDD
jgi:hypothetical protein